MAGTASSSASPSLGGWPAAWARAAARKSKNGSRKPAAGGDMPRPPRDSSSSRWPPARGGSSAVGGTTGPRGRTGAPVSVSWYRSSAGRTSSGSAHPPVLDGPVSEARRRASCASDSPPGRPEAKNSSTAWSRDHPTASNIWVATVSDESVTAMKLASVSLRSMAPARSVRVPILTWRRRSEERPPVRWCPKLPPMLHSLGAVAFAARLRPAAGVQMSRAVCMAAAAPGTQVQPAIIVGAGRVGAALERMGDGQDTVCPSGRPGRPVQRHSLGHTNERWRHGLSCNVLNAPQRLTFWRCCSAPPHRWCVATRLSLPQGRRGPSWWPLATTPWSRSSRPHLPSAARTWSSCRCV